jgi:hypothetical protein
MECVLAQQQLMFWLMAANLMTFILQRIKKEGGPNKIKFSFKKEYFLY